MSMSMYVEPTAFISVGRLRINCDSLHQLQLSTKFQEEKRAKLYKLGLMINMIKHGIKHSLQRETQQRSHQQYRHDFTVLQKFTFLPLNHSLLEHLTP